MMHIFHYWKRLRIRSGFPPDDVWEDYKICPACGLIKKCSWPDDTFVAIDDIRERYRVLKCFNEGPSEVYQKLEIPVYTLTPVEKDGMAVEV